MAYLKDLSCRIRQCSGEVKAHQYPLQRLSVVQRGNAISVPSLNFSLLLGTLQPMQGFQGSTVFVLLSNHYVESSLLELKITGTSSLYMHTTHTHTCQ